MRPSRRNRYSRPARQMLSIGLDLRELRGEAAPEPQNRLALAAGSGGEYSHSGRETASGEQLLRDVRILGWHMQESILQSIGRTPLVRLRRLVEGLQASVYVKVESHNPGGSVKD